MTTTGSKDWLSNFLNRALAFGAKEEHRRGELS